MNELIVSGHYPAINETDVSRNDLIKIYLDDAIDSRSLSHQNIVVVDHLYNPVKGTMGVGYVNQGTPSGVPSILTFQPDNYLDPETTYNVHVNKFPDSVKSINNNYIQHTYSFKFSTGINISTGVIPPNQQLELDLQAAIQREDWCEAARIQAIIDGDTSNCAIPSGIPSGLLPDYLLVTGTNPNNMDSDIPLDKLRFIKLEFNDIMPVTGIDYNSYISVMTKNVLE